MQWTYDEIIDEYKYDWVQYITGPIYFKKEYLNNRPLENFYVDQAPKYSQIFDREIRSFYLVTGLKRMEYWMVKQITEGSEYSKKMLSAMIKRNPHLHNVIKTNLLDNLNTRK